MAMIIVYICICIMDLNQKQEKYQPQAPVFNQVEQYQDNVQILSKQTELNEYRNCIGSILDVFSNKKEQFLKSNGKFSWNSYFSQQIKIQTIQYDMQSLLVSAHLGHYQMRISTLLTSFDEQEIKEEIFAQGAFGSIYKAQISQKQYAIKGINIFIEEGNISLDHIYKQYFLSSLASELEVGPKIQSIMGYDIVVLKGKALFAMQMCKNLSSQFSYSQMYCQLIENLETMHSLKFMHLDIKPDNIAYSQSYRRFVFLDFGFSNLIKESLGKRTKYCFTGTIGFCSEDMKKAYWLSAHTFIDLYYNDFICLKKSQKVILQAQRFQQAQPNNKDQDLFIFSYISPLNLFTSMIRFFQVKYFIFIKDLNSIVKHVQSNFYLAKSFYQILSNQIVEYRLKNPKQLKIILGQLKRYLKGYSFVTSSFDGKIYKILSEKGEPTVTPLTLTIDYILNLEKQYFSDLLNNQEFVQRLFIIFDPRPQFYQQKMFKNKNGLRTRMIDKISESLTNSNGRQMLFYEKTRKTIFFFYQKLSCIKKRQTLVSLRLLFLMIEDFTLLSQIDKLVCLSTFNQIQRAFTILQFALFQSQISYIENQKIEKFRKFFTEMNDKENKQIGQIYKLGQKMLNFNSFGETEQQQAEEILFLLQKMDQIYGQWGIQIKNIKSIFSNKAKLNIFPQRDQKTLLQLVYLGAPTEKMSCNHRFILEYFKFSLKIGHFQKNQQYFRNQFNQKVARVLKIFAQIKNFLGIFFMQKYNIFFYHDFQLTSSLIKIYTEHISSFTKFSGQQCFDCLSTFDWMIKIFEGSQKYLKLTQDYRQQKSDAVIKMIESTYFDIKSRTSQFSQQTWYVTIANCIQCQILFFKQNYTKLTLIFNRQKRNYIIDWDSHIMPIYFNLIYYVFEQYDHQTSEIPTLLYQFCSNALKQSEKIKSQKWKLQMFQKTSQFYLLTKLYLKQNNWQKAFSLIKWLIQKMNTTKYCINKQGLFYILKSSIYLLCQYSGYFLWLIQLKQLNQTPVQDHYPQSVYLQYFIFYNIINYLKEIKHQTQFRVSFDLRPFFIDEIRRVTKGIAKNQSFICAKQIQFGIYECFRIKFQYKTQRKNLISLRRQRQYTLIKSKYIKKNKANLQAPAYLGIQNRLTKIIQNLSFLIPSENFLMGSPVRDIPNKNMCF